MKACFKCGEVKPLDKFYRHKQMKDGHVNKCIDCNLTDVKVNYLSVSQSNEWVEKEKTRGRSKYRRLYVGTGKSNPESNRRYKEKYPEKIRAKNLSIYLKPPFEKAEKHHWSYNEEHFKDVIWMLKKHHMKAHRFIKYDQEFKMYRRKDTNELLNTKAKHNNFIVVKIFVEQD